jgi:hypothetical protein
MSSPIDDSAFKQAVEKFRGKLTPEQAQDFQLTTIDDLKSAIAKLQNQQMSERKLRNLKRLESFVLRMGQFEQVVTVYLNASMFVGFVWVSSSAFVVLLASASPFWGLTQRVFSFPPSLSNQITEF